MPVQLSADQAEHLYRLTVVLTVGRAARRGRGPLHLGARVDPAAVHPAVDLFGRLGIDVSLPNDAAEGRLDVAGRATEAVVKIEMAESRIEIVAPEQADHPPAEPQAFRIGRRTAQKLFGFGELVDFLLRVLAVARLGLFRGLLL